MKCQNQKGLTLLEVLLAITILSIVLVTIMNFFPQMGLMNKQNETKQQATNIAKKELVEWQKAFEANDYDFVQFLSNPSKEAAPQLVENVISDTENVFLYSNTVVNNKKYKVEIKITKKPHLTVKQEDINLPHTDAYLLTLQLYNERHKKISETYGYILYRTGG